VSALRPHLLDSTGGLGYHLGAALRRRRAWAPFRAQVARWLAGWSPGRAELVLVGPSGGYTLPLEFLSRFRRVTVLEPDPLARFILRRRFPTIPFHFEFLDCLALPEGPATLARAHPHAAILFANLLGQVADGGDMPPLAAALRSALAGHPWASYHDVLSAPEPPGRPVPEQVPARATADTLARALWPGRPLPITDHGTLDLVGSGDAQLALWSLAPGAHHVVEWAHQTPPRQARGS
jgi:hypothetical protein